MYRRLRSWFSRVRLAVALLIVLIGVIVIGALLPQMPTELTAAAKADWLSRAQNRYGALADPLYDLGLFHIFHSAWFYIPLALFLLNTLICTWNRLPGAWRAFQQPRRRLSDPLFKRMPQHNIVSAAEWPSFLRSLARRGFRLQIEPDGDPTYLYADRFRLARLGTIFLHVAVLLLLVAVAVRSQLSWRDDTIILPPNQVQAMEHGLAFALRNDGFVIDRYPDGTPADFRATVAVIEDMRPDRQVVIRANHPLHYDGVKFYLRSYGDGAEGMFSVTLLAVYDPSWPVMVWAGILGLVGLILSLWLPFEQFWGQKNADGAWELAGRGGFAIPSTEPKAEEK